MAAGDADGHWMVVVHGTAICARIYGDLRATVFGSIVEAFKKGLELAAETRRRLPVEEIPRLLDMLSGGPDVLSPDLKFIGELTGVAMAWQDGTGQESVPSAADLDDQTDGWFALADFFARPRPVPPARWLWRFRARGPRRGNG